MKTKKQSFQLLTVRRSFDVYIKQTDRFTKFYILKVTEIRSVRNRSSDTLRVVGTREWYIKCISTVGGRGHS